MTELTVTTIEEALGSLNSGTANHKEIDDLTLESIAGGVVRPVSWLNINGHDHTGTAMAYMDAFYRSGGASGAIDWAKSVTNHWGANATGTSQFTFYQNAIDFLEEKNRTEGLGLEGTRQLNAFKGEVSNGISRVAAGAPAGWQG